MINFKRIIFIIIIILIVIYILYILDNIDNFSNNGSSESKITLYKDNNNYGILDSNNKLIIFSNEYEVINYLDNNNINKNNIQVKLLDNIKIELIPSKDINDVKLPLNGICNRNIANGTFVKHILNYKITDTNDIYTEDKDAKCVLNNEDNKVNCDYTSDNKNKDNKIGLVNVFYLQSKLDEDNDYLKLLKKQNILNPDNNTRMENLSLNDDILIETVNKLLDKNIENIDEINYEELKKEYNNYIENANDNELSVLKYDKCVNKELKKNNLI